MIDADDFLENDSDFINAILSLIRGNELNLIINLTEIIDENNIPVAINPELDLSEKEKVEIEIEEENNDNLKEETNEEEPNKIVEDKPAAHLVGRDSV